MRAPAKIKDWLTDKQMAQWVAEASDHGSYQRRMAIWLTHSEALHAHHVADRLGVSKQAVWLWIGQYNHGGPAALARKGRGGRSWAFLTLQEEAALLAPFLRRARAGNPAKPSVIRRAIETHLKKNVSMSYIYRLLKRHGWADILAQSHAATIRRNARDDFESLSNPWQRTT